MATPLITGVSIVAAAMVGKIGLRAWQAFKARPATARVRKFYKGGFQPMMIRRKAALILGVRKRVALDKIKIAHQCVMQANHPDAGGSDLIASKINEAKDYLLGQNRGSTSAF